MGYPTNIEWADATWRNHGIEDRCREGRSPQGRREPRNLSAAHRQRREVVHGMPRVSCPLGFLHRRVAGRWPLSAMSRRSVGVSEGTLRCTPTAAGRAHVRGATRRRQATGATPCESPCADRPVATSRGPSVRRLRRALEAGVAPTRVRSSPRLRRRASRDCRGGLPALPSCAGSTSLLTGRTLDGVTHDARPR